MELMKERKLAALLNESSAANIFQDHGELQELIQEYFLDDNDDDEESSDDEEEDLPNPPSPCETDHESDFSEVEDDRPLVHVQMAQGGEDMACEDEMGNDFSLAQVRNFACRCKQIKVPTEEGVRPELRRGCVSQFSDEEVLAMQLNTAEMEAQGYEGKTNMDFFVMGLFSSNMNKGPLTMSKKKKQQKNRERPRTTFILLNKQVCKTTFAFILGIKPKRLRKLLEHYNKTDGLEPRTSNRGGRKNNTKSLSFDDSQRVRDFIKSYAEDHAVSLPGRVSGFKRDDILLLPSSTSKNEIHRLYVESCNTINARAVAQSTFRKLWNQLLPFIVVARPMTDLCWRCQQNNNRIFRSANLPDAEKTELLLAQQQHLSRVEEERRRYKAMTADCKATVERRGLQELGQNDACSHDITMHYSFDYAQQVHIPSSPAQPGPIYFLTPRKCGIFGVCCEGFPQQVNYLIDEGASGSKGSNAVISYLHHFFENYGLGETAVQLHCDNCSGQNKNRYVFWYFAWRVMKGLHRSISVNFMPPGHTKFAPDWCFGLMKRKFRRTEVSCLQDLCTVVRQSTPVKKVNIPQLVAEENGHMYVPSYNWQDFFRPHFRALPGIKKLGHFRFTSEVPGSVFYQETLADAEQEFRMTPDHQAALAALPDMPDIIPPPGLSLDRQRYLFNSIREFIREEVRDVVAPNPDH